MKFIRFLRNTNILILVFYVLFIIIRGIRLNFLTVVPIVVALIYDAIAGAIVYKLRKYYED